MLVTREEERGKYEMICVEDLVPKDHILRKIDSAIDFTHIYDLVGDMYCPDNSRPVRGNKYGRTEEIYQCESCEGCTLKEKCCKCKGDRKISLNRELTSIHEEVLRNLNCIHGALLRMNRSIQSEGANGIIKWNRAYTRARRRGLEGLNLEIGMICIGFNLHKFYLKCQKAESEAA